jgi:hypothetical protein
MNMKKVTGKVMALLLLLMTVSCDEPETMVTDIVHSDGSVTRRIEMRNKKNNFGQSVLQVPFDKTWKTMDTIEIGEKGDTTWIKRGEKLFHNVDEINMDYKTDSGANKNVGREASFKKTFKWFNTEFRFSEKINEHLAFGYPVKNFLNSEELLYFYSPESIKSERDKGPDSLKYKTLKESVEVKINDWTYKNLVSMWIGEFSELTKSAAGNQINTDSLKAHEDEFADLIKKNESDFDSLWSNGTILKKIIGEENALKYKTEADSAISKVTASFFLDFKEYSIRIVMPGKVINTNGFIDSSEVLIWPVKYDFFITEPYEMWAESKVPNRWAWIVSGLFLLFVLTGIIIRIKKRG